MLLRRNQWIMLAADAVLTVGCYYLAFLIRFEFALPHEFFHVFAMSWPWVLLVRLSGFALFGLYRGVWRYTSLTDLINLLKAQIVSSLVIVVGGADGQRVQGASPVGLYHGTADDLYHGGRSPGGDQTLFSRGAVQGIWHHLGRRIRPGDRRLLVIGAGDEAEMALREVTGNQSLKLYPCGVAGR